MGTSTGRKFLVASALLLWPLRAAAQLPMDVPDLCVGSAEHILAGQDVSWTGVVNKGTVCVFGRLTIASGTKVTVTNLWAMPGGELYIVGDNGETVVTIRDAATDPRVDPEQWGTGLLCLGRCDFLGRPKTSWTRLTEELRAGESVIHVAEATNWAVGDQIVVPDTRDFQPELAGPGFQPEVFTILAIAGTTVTLNKPAAIVHPASRSLSGIERYPPVGNLSRSIRIRSENPNGTRGHVATVADADFRSQYVAYEDLGRTTIEQLHPVRNHLGRYPLHLHYVDGPAHVEGNAIVRSRKWPLTVHHSHGKTLRNNVILGGNREGAGIMSETGTESDNLIEGNLVIGITGDGGRGDEGNHDGRGAGINGTGIWPAVQDRVTRNVVANSQVYGFGLFGLPNIPITMFADNEGVSNGVALSIWWTGSPSADSYVDRFYEWHSTYHGYYGYPTARVILRDWVGRGDPSQTHLSSRIENKGVWFGDYDTIDGAIINPDIQGKKHGIHPPYGISGGASGGTRTFTINGGLLAKNRIGILTVIGITGSFDPKELPPHIYHLNGTRFAENETDVDKGYSPGQSSNLLQLQRLNVTNYNGSGENFVVYTGAQAADFVIPAGPWFGGSAPFAGLTNAQSQSQNGRSIGAEIPPCNTTRPGISGYVCAANPR